MACYLVIEGGLGGGIGGVTATGAGAGGSVINLSAITLFELWRHIGLSRLIADGIGFEISSGIGLG
jgi:hypothetical protein